MKEDIVTVSLEEAFNQMGPEMILKYFELKAKSEIKSEKSTSRYLYVIKSPSGFKVGISYNPNDRLKQLQVGNGDKLSLVYQLDVGPKAVDLERFVHFKLKNHSTNGEWFNCSLSTIKRVINKSFDTPS